MSVAIRIIPCLDVKNGRVVKGVNFQGLKDAGDPVELASRYCAQGADEITFLDVSASHEGRSTMLDVVRRTAEQVFVPLTVGGGVRSVDDVDQLLRAGADKVGINTAAINRPELLTEVARRFGNQVVVLSVPFRRLNGLRLRGHHARRTDLHRYRCRRLGGERSRARRRGDSPELHGCRRGHSRIRHRDDRRRSSTGPSASHRLRRCGMSTRLRHRGRSRCRRRSGSLSVPLRSDDHRCGQECAARRRPSGPLKAGGD